MPTNNADRQELTEQHVELLRQLPGFRLDSGTPCLCGVDAISTRKEYAYSDSLVFHHHCRECGNEFTTWIEG